MATIQEIVDNVKVLRSKSSAKTKAEHLHDMEELILALTLDNISIKSQLKYIKDNLDFKVTEATYRKFLKETFPEEYKVFKMSKNIETFNGFLKKYETETDISDEDVLELKIAIKDEISMANDRIEKRLEIIEEAKNILQENNHLNKEESINKSEHEEPKKENKLQIIVMTFIMIIFTILFARWVAGESIEKDFEKTLKTFAFENNFAEYKLIDCEMDIYGTKACYAELKEEYDSSTNELIVITHVDGRKVWYLNKKTF